MTGPAASSQRVFSPISALSAAPAADQRSTKSAFAVTVVAHLMIIGLLSVQWTAGKRTFENPPMEVDLVAETAPTSTAPVITPEAPATRLGDEDERAIEAPIPEPMPTPPQPRPTPPQPAPPQPAPTPPRAAPVERPAPKAVPRPTPKAPPPAATKAPARPAAKAAPTPAPAPAPKQPAPKQAAAPAAKQPAPKQAAAPAPKATPKQAPAGTRPTGRLDGIVDGLAKGPSNATQSKGAPAAATAAEVKRSIDVAIDGAILPYWRRNVPSGVDIDKLRVVMRINLTRDGRVANITQVGELSGKTDSNTPQQALYVERAMRSIRQAAPFDLPEEHYDQWKVWEVTFRAKGL